MNGTLCKGFFGDKYNPYPAHVQDRFAVDSLQLWLGKIILKRIEIRLVKTAERKRLIKAL
jgi:hypothetical protein